IAGCTPTRIESPTTEEEIVAIVRSARERGEHVKVDGSGPSFTDCACTDGCMIRLDRYQDVLGFDLDARTVTVQAGITLLQLSDALAGHGLAMENMGDVGYQTISGAISTATHGTGQRFRNISSQVVGMSLVLASGDVMRCSAEENTDVFRAAQVSIGGIGVISTVTVRGVPAFNLHSLQEPHRIDDLVERFDELSLSSDHFEFFWWPHTEWAQAITNTRTQDPPSPAQRRSGPVAYLKDIVIENRAFGLIQRAAAVRQEWIPRLAGLTAKTMTRKEMTDRSDLVFTNERLIRFREMEYAVPRQHLLAAFAEIRRMIECERLYISFPVEVRTVAADDIPLSPAYGRDTGYIAVHVFHEFEHEPYFRNVEAIMNAYGGRPHWGKLHFQDAASLRNLYPEWQTFQDVRDRLDPERVFANAYLERVLGR
ncbi:MAG TPA: D-arabinono-1,4-lactone oxidase, partial [Candidatus Dormibacteraeota bacterium]|nr:D-arabinono-1,4-lactone oxidase [Candidatus Dormibacteraeota bacterium]